MGVRGNFWNKLESYKRKGGMDFLRDKKVAVDLSIWIMQHTKAIDDKSVTKAHLRLMFDRTVKLFSKFGASPVFIVDGTPPPLKDETRILRHREFSGIEPDNFPRSGPGVSFPRNPEFLTWVEECLELFKLLGVPFLHAKGEAEALMAQLNRENLVFACITTDSDVILCGARIVITYFSCDDKNARKPIEYYRMSEIEANLGLKRNRFIVISLLVGNDYDTDGVEGIDLDSAFQFVQGCKEDDAHILDRLRETGKGNFSQFLEDNVDKDRRDDMKKICDKISKKKNFPNEEIIRIYSCDDDDHGFSEISWNKEPNTKELVGFLESHLSWSQTYICKRTFPMLSTIILRQMVENPVNVKRKFKDGHYWKFDCITHEKTEHGHKFYKVQWKCRSTSRTQETFEIMDLVKRAAPNKVEKYKKEQEMNKKKKRAYKKKKESHDPEAALITNYFTAKGQTQKKASNLVEASNTAQSAKESMQEEKASNLDKASNNAQSAKESMQEEKASNLDKASNNAQSAKESMQEAGQQMKAKAQGAADAVKDAIKK